MGEKDMSEKILEDYNDVFSDIVNVLLFHGQELIEPSALESISVHSQYKGEDAKLHEQERDVAKKWKRYNVQLQLSFVHDPAPLLPPADIPSRIPQRHI